MSSRWPASVVLIPALVFGAFVALSQESSPAAIDIGSRRELFVDDLLIESAGGVRLQLHRPRPAGKALIFDKPWEGNTSLYVTVFEDGDRYRMYYRGSVHPDYVIRSKVRPGETIPADHPQLTAYAESRDGIEWTKPSLGLYEFNGSKENSIVWMGEGAHNFAPFKDTNPAAPPSERYKALAGGPLITLKSADSRIEDRLSLSLLRFSQFTYRLRDDFNSIFGLFCGQVHRWQQAYDSLLRAIDQQSALDASVDN